MTCSSCHADKTGAGNLSGAHGYHVTTLGRKCSDCHSTVVDSSDNITGPALHVNGQPDISASGLTYNSTQKTCTSACHSSASPNWYDKAHAAGWSSPTQHGYTFLNDTAACKTCHGSDLKGGASLISCDSCHTGGQGWRTNCTFCHGGTDNQSGAPPNGVHGESSVSTVPVGAHTKHVQAASTHTAYGCATCHGKTFTSFDETGHFTAGQTDAAIQFTGVSGTSATWTHASGNCSSLYCHGNGQTAGGNVQWTSSTAMTCSSCHAYKADPTSLSGSHRYHVKTLGKGCESCHAAVVNSSDAVISAALHINGQADVSAAGLTYNATLKTCTSTCHSAGSKGWNDKTHPSGWTAPAQHGYTFLNDTAACKTCHGADLKGGTSYVSCDSCHTGGAAWKTNCTFCHGGTDNTTGAPPLGVHGETAVSAVQVGAHTEHVQAAANHSAWGCAICHGQTFTSLDDPGHITAGQGYATVQFTGVAGTSSAWNRTTANCSSNYCHGNGRTAGGDVQWTSSTALTCSSCHADKTGAGSLSGSHGYHVTKLGKKCSDCHSTVVNSSDAIVGPALHVNGQPDISAAGMTYNSTLKNCTGSCHSAASKGWYDHEHAAGWSDRAQHGYTFFNDTAACKTCHGTDLKGGISLSSCDTCHAGGAVWRTSCTYCHGGTDNTTGAPPAGVRGEAAISSVQVGVHSKHVQASTNHGAYGCALCHGQTFATFDDPGHIPAGQANATVQFTGIAGTSTTWNRTTGNCSSNYCHGTGRAASGNVLWTASANLTCTSCHAYKSGASGLSGSHGYHVTKLGKGCESCHASVVNSSDAIIGPSLHVNGQPDISASGMAYNSTLKNCTGSCHSTASKGWYDHEHAAGWSDRAQHGYTFFNDTAACKTCHGADLKGGISLSSCDTCHAGGAAWRTNCTYCHGGTDNVGGAPPAGVHGETAVSTVPVGAHTKHVTASTTHTAYGCAICHGQTFTTFDDTGHIPAGQANATVLFTGVAGTSTTWNHATGNCSSNYCHGTGQALSGNVLWTSSTAMTCSSCHAFSTPANLSGAHGYHVTTLGNGCQACHSTVVNSSGAIIGTALHINSQADISGTGLTWNSTGKTCTGTCHSAASPAWSQRRHPTGYSDRTQHGYAFFNDMNACKTCHGTTLTGGISLISCDSCHTGGAAWRTNCTYCHGGTNNTTGAPPAGVHGETATTVTVVGWHTPHVTTTATHNAYGCAVCHPNPTAFDTSGHIDITGGAEMSFTFPSGTPTYTTSTGTCNAVYCHGNGRTASGNVVWTTDIAVTCTTCHPSSGMSGDHSRHSSQGCYRCHNNTVDSAGAIKNKALHINQARDVAFSSSGTYNPSTKSCSPSCHGTETW
jgi:predicted CxxxxCH...CXXCH cytochrome family protein